MDPPTVDNLANASPNEVASDPPIYSPAQEACLLSIAQEAAEMFPPGKVYANIQELRQEIDNSDNLKDFL